MVTLYLQGWRKKLGFGTEIVFYTCRDMPPSAPSPILWKRRRRRVSLLPGMKVRDGIYLSGREGGRGNLLRTGKVENSTFEVIQ